MAHLICWKFQRNNNLKKSAIIVESYDFLKILNKELYI